MAKTLASLAAELGVSPTTVSNAYNHPERLSAALREKILAAAAQHGYAGPDPSARNLRRRYTGSVGVLLTEHLTYAFEDMASVDFLAGMAGASAGNATSLTLIPAEPGTAPQAVAQAAVDGYVVYSVAEDDPYLQAARARGLPMVVCDQPTDTGLPFVGIDDREAIKPAARALVEAGHKRIGILAIRLLREPYDGPLTPEQVRRADLHVQRSRVLGALDVFAEAGLDPESIPVITRHINDPANALSAAQELLEGNELSAVLCTTDSMALGVLAYAEQRGMSVPEQLSVTGFDGIKEGLMRGLTTVIQPNKEKGRAARTMLAGLLAGQSPATTQLLETRFHSGSSVGPCRG